jgi:hypothetical protein
LKTVLIILKCEHFFNFLLNLGSALLHTTNDKFPFLLMFFNMIFKNSLLFMSMPNLISINIKYHGHEKADVNFAFCHIHVGG